MQDNRAQSSTRWWPALLIGTLATVRFAYLWLSEAPHTQARVVPTIKGAILTAVLLLIWVLLFSRLRVRVRVTILLTVLALVGLVRASVRVVGVSGDAVPVFEWRWRSEPIFGRSVVAVPAADRSKRGDYPQFYGPSRDATLSGPLLARNWQLDAPVELWRRKVGEAWSSFAVAGKAAVTQEQRGDEEMIVRYDLETGQQIWTHAVRTGLKTTVGGSGPRATPTIADDGYVYALGATGYLTCLELAGGALAWERDLVGEHQVPLADYGTSSSPLLIGELVVVQLARASGALVAHRRNDGEPVWRAGRDAGSYSSPMLATVGGETQILILNQRSIAGHEPSTGELLWHEQWNVPGEKITPPLALGDDRFLVSAGYGAGSRLLRLPMSNSGGVVEELWKSPRLKSKFGSIVLHDGTVFGLDDGVLTALDPRTGERLWKRGRYGHGQIILVGDLLLIQSERGDVALVEANAERYSEVGRLAALTGKTWNAPALAGRYLLVRNNREAACYELPVE